MKSIKTSESSDKCSKYSQKTTFSVMKVIAWMIVVAVTEKQIVTTKS